MLRIDLRIFLLPLLIFSLTPLSGQDTLSLDQSFQELMRRSETYETATGLSFKVIRTERLNDFWSSVMDSVQAQQASVLELQTSLDGHKQIAAQSQQEAEQLRQQLSELQTSVSSITFLGVDMEKGSYQVMVWLIILVLIILGGLLFWRYQQSHHLTATARKELESVTAEFEAHRDKSRKKEVKLKRELQTAVNELEARRRGEI